jgi:hypothetical protein
LELQPPVGLLFIPQVIYKHTGMGDHGALILTGENSLIFHQSFGNSTSSLLVAKQEELVKEMMNFAL